MNAIAVVTQPLLRWFEPRIKSPSLRAFLTEAVVTIAILAPIATVIYYAARQIAQSVQNWQGYLTNWQEYIGRQPRLASLWERLSQNLDLTGAIERFAGAVNTAAMAIATGSFQTVFQALVMLYVLYFLYRDRDRLLALAYDLVPSRCHQGFGR